MGTSETVDSGRFQSRRKGPSRTWEATRIVLGLTYLLGGMSHVVLGLFTPEMYVEFANQALVGFYTDLWQYLVIPNIAILQPLVAVFELSLGAALFWRGRAVLVGHGAGAVFQASLVLSGPWGPINAVIGLIHVFALRQSYDVTIFDRVRNRFETQGA